MDQELKKHPIEGAETQPEQQDELFEQVIQEPAKQSSLEQLHAGEKPGVKPVEFIKAADPDKKVLQDTPGLPPGTKLTPKESIAALNKLISGGGEPAEVVDSLVEIQARTEQDLNA